jgi:ankyrin repeat protein
MIFDVHKVINEGIVKCLVEHETDMNKENKEGETPLSNAYRNGNESVVKIFS